MASEHDRVGALIARLCDRTTNRFNRLPELQATGEFGQKPKRHSGRRDSDNGNIHRAESPHNEWLAVHARILRFARLCGSIENIRAQHRHRRTLDRAREWFEPPIEFMIPDDPRVVSHHVEEIDHQFAAST